LVIEHLEGKKNPADRPSRRPDNEIAYEHMTAKLLATLAVTTITESYDDLLPAINAAQESDCLATEIRPTFVDVSTADERQWRSIDRAQTYDMRKYVPAALRSGVSSMFPDKPRIRSLWSPEDCRARIRRFLLACNGVRDAEVRCRQ